MVVKRGIIEFQWDKGNIGKNLKHEVTNKQPTTLRSGFSQTSSSTSLKQFNSSHELTLGVFLNYYKEAEEVFFDREKRTFKDRLHSKTEERFRIVGKTKKNRLLFVVYTIRHKKVRIISYRNVNKKEVNLYEEKA